VDIGPAKSETRVVEQKQLTKGKAALLLLLSAAAAVLSATVLHGWHIYLGLTIIGVALLIGFLRWNRKY
jgi:hypothetical protein